MSNFTALMCVVQNAAFYVMAVGACLAADMMDVSLKESIGMSHTVNPLIRTMPLARNYDLLNGLSNTVTKLFLCLTVGLPSGQLPDKRGRPGWG
jgi:hypothetical protein